MNTKEFHFELPERLIAQTPLKSRDKSRLLCMVRRADEEADIRETIDHRYFFELPQLLRPGDCLVFNDSRVLPARLLGTRSTGGAVEVLLLHPEYAGENSPGPSPAVRKHPQAVNDRPYRDNPIWECLVRPGKKIKEGINLTFGNGELTATVKSLMDSGNRLIEFHCEGKFLEVLEKLGKMPLPPYIKKGLQDPGRYQTIYSREPGSAAAPTAGLHFTQDLLKKLQSQGINLCYITLHVGLGTFRPVKTKRLEDHIMHSEYFTINEQTAQTINQSKANGGRIIAVGTTSCRTLETAADENGYVAAASGNTDIFIYPGYKFKCIDGLITNFHLPESTLIMLVSAFAGRKRTLAAYNEAIAEKYRFYSFGDCMLIV